MGAPAVPVGTGPGFDPHNPQHVQALRQGAGALHTDQESLARGRAEVAAMQARKAGTPEHAANGRVVPQMGTAPLGNMANAAGAVRGEVEKLVGAECIRIREDRISRSQPHMMQQARDYRIATVKCTNCEHNAHVNQKLPLHASPGEADAWTPDISVWLAGHEATRFDLRMPRETSVVARGGGGQGWFTDGERWYCSRGCTEKYTLKMRGHGGKPLPAVDRVNDASYAKTMYKTPAVPRVPGPSAGDVTTPAAPPVLSSPAPQPVAPVAPVAAPPAPPAHPAVGAPVATDVQVPPKPKRGGARRKAKPPAAATPEVAGAPSTSPAVPPAAVAQAAAPISGAEYARQTAGGTGQNGG